MTVDPDAAVRTCPVCLEALPDAIGDRHTWCLPANIARPPVAPVWPAATRQDDPAVRSTVALNKARAELRTISDALDFLAKQPHSADLPLAADHRVHHAAGFWIGDIAQGLRELRERTTVAKEE